MIHKLKTSDMILVRCPMCKKELFVPRDEEDPPTAVIAEFYCEKCMDPDQEELQVYYYCMDGKEFEEKDWN